LDKTAIADAPFRKDWHLQMFKRALRDAVASGKDFIGWTTGETQAERYDLSKQVDQVTWYENDDGTFNIGFRKDGFAHNAKNKAKASELPDLVGKEVAKKIVDAASGNDVSGELSGLDLKVGGEGMKGFYDKMLPSTVNKYVKKWGAKVEDGDLDLENSVPIHKVMITDVMRTNVRAGQALFSRVADIPSRAPKVERKVIPTQNQIDLVDDVIDNPVKIDTDPGEGGKVRSIAKKYQLPDDQVLDFNDDKNIDAGADRIASVLDKAFKQYPKFSKWYSSRLRMAMNILTELDPDLNKSEDQFIIKVLLAITSNGNEVSPQTRESYRIYQEWKKTGSIAVKTTEGTRVGQILSQLDSFDKLLKKFGYLKMKKFMAKSGTVRDLRLELTSKFSMTSKQAASATGGELVGEIVPFAFILGPKLGSFYNNLNGNFDTTTMDRWFMRTFGRAMGQQFLPKSIDIPRVRFLKSIKDLLNDPTESSFLDQKVTKTSEFTLRDLLPEDGVIDLQNLKRLSIFFSKVDNRSFNGQAIPAPKKGGGKSALPLINAFRLSTNNFCKIADGFEIIEAPKNGSHRRFIRKVMDGALTQFNKQSNLSFTPAEAQALLWYYEKLVHDSNGSRQKDEAPDYGTAANKLYQKIKGEDSSKFRPSDAVRRRRGRGRDVLDRRAVGRGNEAPLRRDRNVRGIGTPSATGGVRTGGATRPDRVGTTLEVVLRSKVAEEGIIAPGTPAFKEWYGDSKVVDKNGEPLVVYHVTDAKFDAFDPQMAALGGTFWFTENLSKIESGETGAGLRPNQEKRVIDVYLSVQKMAGWDEYEKFGIGELIDRGFDGIKLDDDYVVFSPEQIKSATGNNGNFDSNDPSILRSQVAEPGIIAPRTPAFKSWFGDSKVVDENGEPLVVKHGTSGLKGGAFLKELLGSNTGSPSAFKGFFFSDSQRLGDYYNRSATAQAQYDQAIKEEIEFNEEVNKILRKRDKLIKSLEPLPPFRDGLAEKIWKMYQFSGKEALGMIEGVWGKTPELMELHDQLREMEGNQNARFKSVGMMQASFEGEEAVEQAFDLSGETLDVYLSMQNPLEVDHEGDRKGRSYSDLIDKAISEGRDGVIIRNSVDPLPATIYIAFEPTQIKSATGNNGNFDPNDPSILRSQVAEPDIMAPRTPAFKSWFGDSKVVDENGEPLVVYHGSEADINAFELQGDKRTFTNAKGFQRTMIGDSGFAFWFAPTPDKIRAGHNFSSKSTKGVIYPLYLSIKNPLVIDDDTREIWQSAVESRDFPLLISEEAMLEVKAEGYDGVYYLDQGKTWDGNVSSLDEIIAFEPTQIKSAIGNNGNFDPNDPSILRSQVAESSDDRAIIDLIDMLNEDVPDIMATNEAAQAERVGEQTIGRPDLANPATSPEGRKLVNAVDEARNEQAEVQSHKEWETQARDMLAKDKAGVKRRLLEVAQDSRYNGIMDAVDVKASQMLVAEMVEEAVRTGNADQMREVHILTYGYREARSENARALAAGRDPHKTPAERHKEFLAAMLFRPNKETDKRIKNALSPAQKSRDIDKLKAKLKQAEANQADKAEIVRLRRELLEVKQAPSKTEILTEASSERLKKIEAALEGMGVSLEDIFAGETVVRIKADAVIGNYAAQLPEDRKKAVSMLERGVAIDDIRKATGLSMGEINDITEDFERDFAAKHLAKYVAAAKGMKVKGSSKADLEVISMLKSAIAEDLSEAEYLEIARKAMLKDIAAMGMGKGAKSKSVSAQKRRKAGIGQRRKGSMDKPRKEAKKSSVAGIEYGWEMDAQKRGDRYYQGAAQRDLNDNSEPPQFDINDPIDTGRVFPTVQNGSVEGLEYDWEMDAPKRGDRYYQGVAQRDLNDNSEPPQFDINDPIDTGRVFPTVQNGSVEGLEYDWEMDAQKQGDRYYQGAAQRDLDDNLEPPQFDISNPIDVARIARIAETVDASGFDMAYEFWINAILSGPQTHIANITGNALNMALDMTLQRGMEVAINSTLSLVGRGDQNSAQIGEFKHMIRGIMPGIMDGWKSAQAAWMTETSQFESRVLGTQMELGGMGKLENYKVSIPGKKGRVIRGSGRALFFMDELFKGVIGRIEVGAQAYRIAKKEGLSGDAMERRITGLVNLVGSDAWVKAADKAKELTFQSDFEEGTTMHKAAQIAFNTKRDARWSRFIVPFVKTILNIFAVGVRKSPLGSINLVTRMAQQGLLQANGDGSFGAKAYAQGDLIKHLAEQVIAFGTTAILYGAMEGDDDDDEKFFLITGSRAFNTTKYGVSELHNRAGTPAYSLRMGNFVFSYGRYEPVSTALGITTDIARTIKQSDKQSGDELLGLLASSIGEQVMSKTFARGLSDMFEAARDPKNFFSRWASNFASSWMPNIIKQPLRLSDSSKRNSSVESRTMVGSLVERTKEQMLPSAKSQKIDVWGNEVKAKGNALSRLLVPGTVGTVERLNRADKTLQKWNQLHPADTYAPEPPDRRIELNGEPYYMNDKEFVAFQKEAGQKAFKLIQRKPLNQAEPTEAEIKLIKNAIASGREAARATFRRKNRNKPR
jgi:hypothetical protein